MCLAFSKGLEKKLLSIRRSWYRDRAPFMCCSRAVMSRVGVVAAQRRVAVRTCSLEDMKQYCSAATQCLMMMVYMRYTRLLMILQVIFDDVMHPA